jgi:hypothetical protein
MLTFMVAVGEFRESLKSQRAQRNVECGESARSLRKVGALGAKRALRQCPRQRIQQARQQVST